MDMIYVYIYIYVCILYTYTGIVSYSRVMFESSQSNLSNIVSCYHFLKKDHFIIIILSPWRWPLVPSKPLPGTKTSLRIRRTRHSSLHLQVWQMNVKFKENSGGGICVGFLYVMWVMFFLFRSWRIPMPSGENKNIGVSLVFLSDRDSPTPEMFCSPLKQGYRVNHLFILYVKWLKNQP